MKVTSVQYRTTPVYRQPSFRGWERQVFKNHPDNPFLEILSHRNNTYLFRDGNNIPDIIDAIVEKTKNQPKINMHIYGCSNGAEPMSMYMYLYSKYGPKVASKFNFKGKDFDIEAIIKAKSHILPVSSDEYYKIETYTFGNFDKFFDTRFLGIPDNLNRYSEKGLTDLRNIFDIERETADSITTGRDLLLNEQFANKIEYEVANILDDYKNVEPERSIVSARNFWPYLEYYEIFKLAENLGKHLKKGSGLVVGNYDVNWLISKNRQYPFSLPELICRNGFERVGKTEYYFEKI